MKKNICEMKNFKQLLYKSKMGEVKTLKQWIEFANRNDAIFACGSEEDKIKIVTKDYFNEKVLRELTEYKIFRNKYEYQKNRFRRAGQKKIKNPASTGLQIS